MNSTSRPRSRSLSRPRLLLLAPLLLLALAGCGGSSGGTSSSDSSGSRTAGDSAAESGGGSMSLVAPDASGGAGGTTAASVQRRAVVATGSVSLVTKDVTEVRTAVDRLLDSYDGVLADEQTTTDRRGRPEHTTLTVRVPSRSFGAVMGRLARIGTLVDSSRQAEDVTTQVIDVEQRISAQRAGLRRLRELISTSGSLTALLAVEKEVTDRQATLDSLEQQSAYLADQTSLSTITLTVDRRSAPAVTHGGFLSALEDGLHDGWAAFVAVLAGLLRAAGATLPFVVAALVLWLPVRAVVRRVQRGQAGPVVEAAAESSGSSS